MAQKTLTNLRDALASMWNLLWADLDPADKADIDSWINAALFECYAPETGKRPEWATKYHSDIIEAPVAVTLTLTHGATVVTGHAFEAKFAGSFVRIGDRFYRYAGKVSSVDHLLQPWDGETGDYAAVVYHNAVALPWSVQEVLDKPSLLGVGPLTALPSAETEIALRSAPSFDYQPRSGRVPFAYSRPQFNPSLFTDVGAPVYYHVDSTSVGPTFAIGNRMHFYPIPERAYTFEMRAAIVPAALDDGEATPLLPLQAIDNILLPIAREKLVKNTATRRFTGNNAALIIDEAKKARATLLRLSRPQRQKNQTAGTACGW